MPSTNKINAVIYARYSSDAQREESIEDQLRVCRAFAGTKGYEVLDVYADSAITGRTDKRPQFQKMIADSEFGNFEVMIVYKLARFARGRYLTAIY